METVFPTRHPGFGYSSYLKKPFAPRSSYHSYSHFGSPYTQCMSHEMFNAPNNGEKDYSFSTIDLQAFEQATTPVIGQHYTNQHSANLQPRSLGFNSPPLSYIPDLTSYPTNHSNFAAAHSLSQISDPLSHLPQSNIFGPEYGNVSSQNHYQNQQGITPQFPPQNLHIPDIFSINSVNMEEGMGNQFDEADDIIERVAAGSADGSPKSGSASPEDDSDDSVPLSKLAGEKHQGEDEGGDVSPVPVKAAKLKVKKAKSPRKRKKKDPNEPQKPVSAYALFFRDTQSAIKGKNPSASFGEVSKVVASMWDSLDPDSKNVYKERTEKAKKEYLRQLAAYRATQVSQEGAVSQPSTTMPSFQENPPTRTVVIPPSETNPVTLTFTHIQAPGTDTQADMNVSTVTTQAASPKQYAAIAPNPRSPVLETLSNIQNEVISRHCTRNGCNLPSVDHPSWDNEYCSNQCVVTHCRDVFNAWIAARQTTMLS